LETKSQGAAQRRPTIGRKTKIIFNRLVPTISEDRKILEARRATKVNMTRMDETAMQYYKKTFKRFYLRSFDDKDRIPLNNTECRFKPDISKSRLKNIAYLKSRNERKSAATKE